MHWDVPQAIKEHRIQLRTVRTEWINRFTALDPESAWQILSKKALNRCLSFLTFRERMPKTVCLQEIRGELNRSRAELERKNVGRFTPRLLSPSRRHSQYRPSIGTAAAAAECPDLATRPSQGSLEALDRQPQGSWVELALDTSPHVGQQELALEPSAHSRCRDNWPGALRLDRATSTLGLGCQRPLALQVDGRLGLGSPDPVTFSLGDRWSTLRPRP